MVLEGRNMTGTAHQRPAAPPEASPAHGGGNGRNGGDLREMVAILEAHMQHLATKAWVLGGVIGGMVLAAIISLSVLKLFS